MSIENNSPPELSNIRISVPKSLAAHMRKDAKQSGLTFSEIVTIAIVWGIFTKGYYDVIYHHKETLQSWRDLIDKAKREAPSL